MKIRKPQIALSKLESFFSELSDINRSKKDQAKAEKWSKEVLWYLNSGIIKVWDPTSNQTNAWIKKAILTYFSSSKAFALNSSFFEYWDKLPIKKRTSLKNVRVVPGAIARYGSFIDQGSILMPSFVNIGAYVGKNSMIDTWATVGSCAYVGSGVHVSGGVGIGGVLEPVQANPVVIEDGVFLGSRSIIVEGVRVRKEAVIGAGVTLTASTKIIDVRSSSQKIFTGEIPERSVVIPGSTGKVFAAGEYQVPCALIIGTRTTSTDLKTSLNQALREHNVSV